MKNIKFIKGAEPFFGKYKKNILNDINFCLKTGNLSNGRFVNKFEKDLKKFFKSKYALSINSGGTALELAILSMGFRNKEIIVPSQTFIASPNSILRAGLKPVYCDIKYNTGCLDPQEVIKKINKKTCAIMYVHMFGIMTDDIFKIRSICKKKNLLLIEDASHAHGAKLKGVYAGNIGDIGCFSIICNKTS
jgi:Predicted pyridoxal phosphate-dependent enzyme apparently involved in regulation of cell wall biogenesis